MAAVYHRSIKKRGHRVTRSPVDTEHTGQGQVAMCRWVVPAPGETRRCHRDDRSSALEVSHGTPGERRLPRAIPM
eukprot:7222584-Karenia_brevis.AAC.1